MVLEDISARGDSVWGLGVNFLHTYKHDPCMTQSHSAQAESQHSTMQASDPLHGSYAYTETLKGVYFGPGSVKMALPKLLSILQSKKALVVTGKSLHTRVCFYAL